MNKSESIKNIASAIVAAQAEIENAEKNSTNPNTCKGTEQIRNITSLIINK
jgi:hypothetical protein